MIKLFFLFIFYKFFKRICGFQKDHLDDETQENNAIVTTESNQSPFFTPQIYMNVGRALMISILDIFQKNPYTRVPNSNYKTMDQMRKQIGWECARTDRFRRDPYSY